MLVGTYHHPRIERDEAFCLLGQHDAPRISHIFSHMDRYDFGHCLYQLKVGIAVNSVQFVVACIQGLSLPSLSPHRIPERPVCCPLLQEDLPQTLTAPPLPPLFLPSLRDRPRGRHCSRQRISVDQIYNNPGLGSNFLFIADLVPSCASEK